ncbi:MAG: ParA family protein [Xenococcaceae cyanobacterium]
MPPYPSKEGISVQQDLIDSGIPVFKTMIRRSSGFAKSALAGVTIRDLKDKTRVAWSDYKAVGKEIEEIING